jgi:hypothetical protein
MFHQADTAFYAIFMAEFAVKVLTKGFVFTPGAYLNTGWNKLDFLVIIISTMNFLPGTEASSTGRILRMGRCLRPLRMINKNEGMKVIINAILDSVATNLGVMALALMFYLLFGILGVSIFGGRFWHCSCDWAVGPSVWPDGSMYEVVEDGTASEWEGMNDKDLCLGSSTMVVGDATYHISSLANVHTAPNCMTNSTQDHRASTPACINATETACEWRNKPYHFDNLPAAVEALFTASTLAGWTDLMESSMDVSNLYQQPQPFESAVYCVYWIFFIFLLGFFFINLFVGVLVDFIARSNGAALMTQAQQQWSDMRRTMSKVRPDYRVLVAPKNNIRSFCFMIVESEAWKRVGAFAIIGNVAVMMMECDEPDINSFCRNETYDAILDDANLYFLVFFTVEILVCVIAYGPQLYISGPWNRFDVLVVGASWLSVGINVSGVQAARAFRAFRVALVLKGRFGAGRNR